MPARATGGRAGALGSSCRDGTSVPPWAAAFGVRAVANYHWRIIGRITERIRRSIGNHGAGSAVISFDELWLAPVAHMRVRQPLTASDRGAGADDQGEETADHRQG